jgi:hypothetical protein
MGREAQSPIHWTRQPDIFSQMMYQLSGFSHSLIGIGKRRVYESSQRSGMLENCKAGFRVGGFFVVIADKICRGGIIC